MTEANAGTRGDNEGDVAALVVARCLHFAAAPNLHDHGAADRCF